LHMLGRRDEAVELFERLIGLRNDLGLLSEEYDATLNRQVGNFPQAFSHVSLVNSAYRLSGQSSDDQGTAAAMQSMRTRRGWRRGPRASRAHPLTGHDSVSSRRLKGGGRAGRAHDGDESGGQGSPRAGGTKGTSR